MGVCLQKAIFRKYVHPIEAQSVWKDFQDHIKISSKSASEKRRLTQFVTNTVLNDNYKGTNEQFVLHFNEQFRELEEISDPSEQFPPQIKLQLLQNAVRPINDLRIVETLDESQSITTGYIDLTYHVLLGCVKVCLSFMKVCLSCKESVSHAP